MGQKPVCGRIYHVLGDHRQKASVSGIPRPFFDWGLAITVGILYNQIVKMNGRLRRPFVFLRTSGIRQDNRDGYRVFCSKSQLSARKRNTGVSSSSNYGENLSNCPVFWHFHRLTIGKMRIILFIIRHGHLCLWRKIENGKKVECDHPQALR